MMDVGALIIYAAAVVLAIVAFARRDMSFRLGLRRALEQAITLLPRMVFALIAAGFVVKLIPTDIIVRFLGSGSGITGIIVGSLAGLMIPSGPVIAFATAAALAAGGASVPALIAFLTGWSVFAAHRVIIFEIPLLGSHFVRLRMLSVLPLPVLAGCVALFLAGI